jgi:hypothetical protein
MVTAVDMRRRVALAMREVPEFTEYVRVHARAHMPRGLLQFHVHRADKSPAGFPDVTIWTAHGVLWRELKRECICTPTRRCDRHPTPEQTAWLETGGKRGDDVGLWTPMDLLEGRVDAELVAVTRPTWIPTRDQVYRYDCVCGRVHLGDLRSASPPRPPVATR